MRICSLLPSATEIVADLGLVDALVGVSEECRWPAEVVGKPVVTAPKRNLAELSSARIDDGRPITNGIIMCGKTTTSRSGTTGRVS